MQRKHLGNIVIAMLVAVNVALYAAFPPVSDGRDFFLDQIISEVLSSSAMILMSCAFVLALRPRILEPFFGGLDQMYKSHKTSALSALALVLIHFFLVPLRADRLSPGRMSGKIALIGLLVLIALTLAPRLPIVGGYIRLAYHRWRLTHKFIGLFFLAGLLHVLLVDTVTRFAPAPLLYWNAIAYIGLAAYLYKELLEPFLRRHQTFVVEAARKLNASTLEVALKPKRGRPSQTAGQFLFVSFPGDPTLSESHPFTVSSSPREGNLRLSIKASGDWTKRLYEHLKPGVEARVDGCYGQLNYKTGGKRQIWIAGGIGVTPFLSWVRDFDGALDHEIDFFYTVRAEADALFADEFTAAAQKHDNFRATITVSSKDGSLTADKIVASLKGDLAGRHLYMCGPLPMTEAFRKQFRARGIPAGNIHFEEFNFR